MLQIKHSPNYHLKMCESALQYWRYFLKLSLQNWKIFMIIKVDAKYQPQKMY
jgi:hypothetical protein